MKESKHDLDAFSNQDMEEALALPKTGKAGGLNNITTEMIQHFGTTTRKWVLGLINKCAETETIQEHGEELKLWPCSNQEKTQTTSYRPISLLCILYKLYERMIMARISPAVEEQLTPD